MNCLNHPAVEESVYPCDRCGAPFCSDCLVSLQGKRYCARCKTEQLADLRSGVDTTQVQLAGLGRRFAAIWVDGFILGTPVLIVMFGVMMPALFANKGAPPPPWTAWVGWVMAPIYIVYEGIMLTLRGQTLGKMALGIRVTQANGNAISRGQAWGRAVVRGLFVSFLSIINYIPALFTKEKTCIHDMAAKTRVVVVR